MARPRGESWIPGRGGIKIDNNGLGTASKTQAELRFLEMDATDWYLVDDDSSDTLLCSLPVGSDFTYRLLFTITIPTFLRPLEMQTIPFDGQIPNAKVMKAHVAVTLSILLAILGSTLYSHVWGWAHGLVISWLESTVIREAQPHSKRLVKVPNSAASPTRHVRIITQPNKRRCAPCPPN